jgi:hypothetical protein
MTLATGVINRVQLWTSRSRWSRPCKARDARGEGSSRYSARFMAEEAV